MTTGVLAGLAVYDEMRRGSGTGLTVQLVTEAFDVVERVEDEDGVFGDEAFGGGEEGGPDLFLFGDIEVVIVGGQLEVFLVDEVDGFEGGAEVAGLELVLEEGF